MLFQKGVSGNPGGRPKGALTKDRLNYLDLQVWFKKLCEDLAEIEDPEKRVIYELQVADKLLGKMQNLPATPEMSAENAKIRQEIMDAIETGVPKPDEPLA